MIIIICILLLILAIIFAVASEESYSEFPAIMCIVCVAAFVIMLWFGLFNGFINHPATSGTHQGVITAVDLEGVMFRHYDVYLKSSGYTSQSDETKYCLYSYETELINKMNEYIGKEVKLEYGHDGGYIGFQSCGTYHLKNITLVEEENVKD